MASLNDIDTTSWGNLKNLLEVIPKILSNFEIIKTSGLDQAVLAAATAKSTPIDADVFPILDSAASNALKKISYADLKTALNGSYAPLASPELTGTPTAPTAAAGTSTTQIATTAFAMGMVAQTITNGVTTSAPSQDAVFDALLLKATKNAPVFTGIASVYNQGEPLIIRIGFNEENYWSFSRNWATGALQFSAVETNVQYGSVLSLMPSSGRVGLGGITAPNANLHSKGSTIIGTVQPAAALSSLGVGECYFEADDVNNRIYISARKQNGNFMQGYIQLTAL